MTIMFPLLSNVETAVVCTLENSGLNWFVASYSPNIEIQPCPHIIFLLCTIHLLCNEYHSNLSLQTEIGWWKVGCHYMIMYIIYLPL